MTADTLSRFAGRVLVVIGLTTLLWSGFVWTTASYDQLIRTNAPLPAINRVVAPGRGSTLGRLEVPRLGLSTIVIEGDDEYSLLVGAGHLPETPLPWNDGNSVLAGHRDTDFRPLRNIQVGDTIRFQTSRYRGRLHRARDRDRRTHRRDGAGGDGRPDADAHHLLSLQLHRASSETLHRPGRAHNHGTMPCGLPVELLTNPRQGLVRLTACSIRRRAVPSSRPARHAVHVYGP